MKSNLVASVLLQLWYSAVSLGPQDFKIQSLPYFEGDLPEGYAGFLPVAAPADQKDPDSALFFWLTMKNDGTAYDENTPLLLWLNGGPGASSQIGLFTENGPYVVTEQDGKPQVTLNEHSWSKFGHLLVVDQPVGTGYSYAKDKSFLVTTDQEGAEQFRRFLKNFFTVFPNLASNPFYLTGESYCGKYHPYMARQILNHPEDKINLKALLLGNGYIEPAIQRTTMSVLSGAAGLISGNMIPQIEVLKKKCLEAAAQDPDKAPESCDKIPDYISKVSGGVDLYNIYKIDHGLSGPFAKYLNGQYTSEVLEALHVTQSPKTPIYSPSDESVAQALASVNIDSSVPIFNDLLAREFPMLWYIGQFDTQDGVAGHQEILKLLKWKRKEEFNSAPRWLYKTEAGELGGYFKQVENFSWMIFSRSGHLAPTDQPQNALAMISDYISKGYSIPTRDGYDSPQKAMCSFMNDCNGHGQCDQLNGLCKCEEGYRGADCSTPTSQVKSIKEISNLKVAANSWVYILTDQNESFTHISGDSVFEVYKVSETQKLIPSKEVYDSKSQQVMGYVAYQKEKHIIGIYNPSSNMQLALNSFSSSQMKMNSKDENTSYVQTILLIILNLLCFAAVVMIGVLLKKRSNQKRKEYAQEMNLILSNSNNSELRNVEV